MTSTTIHEENVNMLTTKSLLRCFTLLITAMSMSILHAQPMNCHAIINGKQVEVIVRIGSMRGVESSIIIGQKPNQLIGQYFNLTQLWDGHLTGMMTTEGMSIKYDNNFGIIRNVDVTAFVSADADGVIRPGNGWIQSFHFDQCKNTSEQIMM